MNCWEIILRVKAKTGEEMNDFKNYVKSSQYVFDFEEVIPIPELHGSNLNQTERSKLYLLNWGTYYHPTFVSTVQETVKTICYRFDADQVPEAIFFRLSHLFHNVKIDIHVELDRKYILGGGMLKAVYRFNYFDNKRLYEINDLSYRVYEEELMKRIENLNHKNRASKFEMEDLFELTDAYLDYKNVPDKEKFLKSIYPLLNKFPRIQSVLDTLYPGTFREFKIQNLLSDL